MSKSASRSSQPAALVARLSAVGQLALRRYYSRAALKETLRRNPGLRIISLAIAIGLWIFVNAGLHGASESFSVPVSYGRLPLGFVITNPHPEQIKIQVAGPRTLLSLIEPNRLTLRLDLSGVAVGQASFKVGPDSFNVPRQTTVTGISPSQIVLDIDRVVRRETAIHVNVRGKVAAGYKVASIQIDPKTVGLRGPGREVARIDEVESEQINLTGLDADSTQTVPLIAPGGMVRMDNSEVTVKIALTQVITEKQFRGVGVQVRGTDYKYRLWPQHIDVTLRGPELVLSKIDPKSAAYVDGNAIAPGYYDMPVEFSLPDGVQVVRISADTVRVRVYHEKQAANG